MDFIKSIVKFAKSQSIKIVILVTDYMTTHAHKYIASLDGLKIVHFNYDETGVEHMASHIAQPMTFRALDTTERKEFIRKNPNYKTELPRYAVNDALVKYYGMNIDDIVYIEDNDRQSGLVVEHGVVVEDL